MEKLGETWMPTSILDVPGLIENFINLDMLLFVLFQIAVMGIVTFYFSQPGHMPEIRKIPLVDAYEDIVASSAERGRPVFINMKRGREVGGSMASNQAFMETIRYVCKNAGDAGAGVVMFTNDERAYLQGKDYARQGYLESRRPELFKDEDYLFIAGGEWESGGKELYMLGEIRRQKPGGLISLGNFFSEVINTAEVANEEGALTAACADGGWETCFNACICDFYSMGDEYVGAAAWMVGQENPKTLEALIGGDVIKISILIGMMVVFIAALAGFNLFPGA